MLNPLYEEQIQRLFDARESIGRYDVKAALNCICGMAYEKEKALCHPYPTLVDKIEKYGFDGKQLSHILRLDDFMRKYIQGISYKECLTPTSPEFLLNVKRNKLYDVDTDKNLAYMRASILKQFKDEYLGKHEVEKNAEVDALLDDVCVQCMKLNFLNFVENNR